MKTVPILPGVLYFASLFRVDVSIVLIISSKAPLSDDIEVYVCNGVSILISCLAIGCEVNKGIGVVLDNTWNAILSNLCTCVILYSGTFADPDKIFRTR